MLRLVIIPVVLHALVAVATLLWLLWCFIPAGNVFNGLVTLLILLLAGWAVFKNSRSEDITLTDAELALSDTGILLYWYVVTCRKRCFRKVRCVKQPGMVAAGR